MTSKCGKYKNIYIQRKGEIRTKERMEGKKKYMAIEGQIKMKKICLNSFIFYVEMIGLL